MCAAHRQALRPLYVSPAEAARLAGIGRTRLYAAITSGALPSLKLGSRRLIKLDDLEAWLDSHKSSEFHKGAERDRPA